MNNATAKVLFLIAAALGTPFAGSKVLNPPLPDAPVVVAPETAEVGELVTLRHPGSRVEWLLDTKDYVVVGPGEIAASFRTSGRHEIVVSALVNGRVVISKVYIQVGSAPTPTPTPAPTPTPTPAPTAPTAPTPAPTPTPAQALTKLVYDWCEQNDAGKECSRQLYINFTDAASTTDTAARMVAKTARLNASVHGQGCSVVLGKVQLYFLQNLTGKDFLQHQCAWDAVAQGFLDWSNK